ncbi:hypothetical protein DFP72DRAFT_1044383 [Ephemerocybe angulata]|uniref:Uncharacterized protein n=1 Tax=Ephemerocybe angulata TaxID=980116 RepID=A0A8H6MAZ9_9AGAR|nr:hypothetical protein DFP72DRAFT_1044383 [Tulosesus angulatus]
MSSNIHAASDWVASEMSVGSLNPRVAIATWAFQWKIQAPISTQTLVDLGDGRHCAPTSTTLNCNLCGGTLSLYHTTTRAFERLWGALEARGGVPANERGASIENPGFAHSSPSSARNFGLLQCGYIAPQCLARDDSLRGSPGSCVARAGRNERSFHLKGPACIGVGESNVQLSSISVVLCPHCAHTELERSFAVGRDCDAMGWMHIQSSVATRVERVRASVQGCASRLDAISRHVPEIQPQVPSPSSKFLPSD